MNKEKRRNEYKEKYTKIYSELFETNRIKTEDIIGRLADTCVYLDECNEHLAEEGLVVSMPQGNYSIDRENPYSKVFNDKMKLFNALIKALDDMQPSVKESTSAKAGAALKAFIGNSKGCDGE